MDPSPKLEEESGQCSSKEKQEIISSGVVAGCGVRRFICHTMENDMLAYPLIQIPLIIAVAAGLALPALSIYFDLKR